MRNHLTITDREYLRRIEGKFPEAEVAEFKAQMRPLFADYLRVARFRFRALNRAITVLYRDWRFAQWKRKASGCN